MIISNITPPQVWSASSRSLTNFGSGALAVADNLNGSLAGAASIDLRPSAGVVGISTAGILTGAAATGASTIAINDGTRNIVCATTAAAANAPIGFTIVQTNGVGLSLFNNDATHVANYSTSGLLLTI